MTDDPPVSVLLPVRQEPYRIRSAIQSILCQTSADLQLVVVDDNSVDGTWEKIAAVSDPRMTALRNPRRLGIAGTTNRALALARGRYVALMDGDDISFPDRLRMQVDFLDSHADVDILGTGAAYVDEDGTDLATVLPPEDHEEIVARPFRKIAIINPTVMMRREVIEALGGFNPRYRRGQDYEFFLRARNMFRFHNLREPLMRYLWRSTSKKWEGIAYHARAIAAAIRRERLPYRCYLHLARTAGLMALGPLYATMTRWRLSKGRP